MYKPLIGILSRPTKEEDKLNVSVREEYRKAIIKLGGNPICILPPQELDYYTTRVSEISELTKEEKEMLKEELDLCDGIILPGGFKISECDNYAIEYCIKNNKPILGICLGMQEMANYPFKKDNFKVEKNETKINHSNEEEKYIHKVIIDKNSKLYEVLKEETFQVNSLHNYHAINTKDYSIIGYSEDGLIEAIEYKENDFNIGVQWHPERLLDDKIQYKIFEEFIKSCIAKKNK